jgi:hypothetical protein
MGAKYGEDILHDGEAEPAVNDKLGQRGRAPVRVAAMLEEFRQVAKLRHGKVRRKGGLLAFFSDNADDG